MKTMKGSDSECVSVDSGRLAPLKERVRAAVPNWVKRLLRPCLRWLRGVDPPSAPATSPEAVFERWRRLRARGVAESHFAEGGLDNVWERYPGKRDRQIVAVECLQNVCRRRVEGAVAEFGCHRGHTAIQLLQVLAASGDHSPVLLFDSFSGVPHSSHPSDRHWRAGALTASFEEVSARFAQYPNVALVRGYFADTLS